VQAAQHRSAAISTPSCAEISSALSRWSPRWGCTAAVGKRGRRRRLQPRPSEVALLLPSSFRATTSRRRRSLCLCAASGVVLAVIVARAIGPATVVVRRRLGRRRIQACPSASSAACVPCCLDDRPSRHRPRLRRPASSFSVVLQRRPSASSFSVVLQRRPSASSAVVTTRSDFFFFAPCFQ